MSDIPQAKDDRLEQRFSSERRFHDAKYGGGDLYPRHYKANPTVEVYNRMVKGLGDLHGKQVLEYGCGEGWTTVDLAQRGAVVAAFDISEQGVAKTHEALARANLAAHCSVRQMAAEELDYPKHSFDLAVGFAILHHLDIPKALRSLHGVLRPGGIAVFAEPLGTNPLINLYRHLTPQYRTPDETPLVMSDVIAVAKDTGFSAVEHRECYFFALASVALLYVPLVNRAFSPLNKILCKCDDWLLPYMGPLRQFAWYTIITFKK